MKRGQLTTFIVLGLILLIIGVISYYVITNFSEKQQYEQTYQKISPNEIVEVTEYTKDCLEKTADNALILFGMQGGYIYERLFVDSLFVDSFTIPYYNYYGRDLNPEKSFLEDSQLSDYIKYNLDNCLNYDDFKNINVEFGIWDIKTNISKNSVKFTANNDIRIIKQNSVQKIPMPLTYTVNLRLDDLLNITQQITSLEIANDGYIPLSYLLDVRNKGYNVTVIPYDNQSIFYVFIDEQYKLKELPYIFQMATIS